MNGLKTLEFYFFLLLPCTIVYPGNQNPFISSLPCTPLEPPQIKLANDLGVNSGANDIGYWEFDHDSIHVRETPSKDDMSMNVFE